MNGRAVRFFSTAVSSTSRASSVLLLTHNSLPSTATHALHSYQWMVRPSVVGMVCTGIWNKMGALGV